MMGNSQHDKTYPGHSNEQRVRELLRYNILDTPDEQEFDDLAKIAAYLCGVNHAQINFLEHDRQWSKSCHGWNVKEIPLEESICRYTIQQEKYMVINNLGEDHRFRDYPYVQSGKVKFYAGVVLHSADGISLGTLCVFGEEAGELSEKQLESLCILGNEVETQLELRLKREELISKHKKIQQDNIFLQNSTDIRLILDTDTLEIAEINDEARQLLGHGTSQIIGTPLPRFLQQPYFQSEVEKWESSSVKEQLTTVAIINTSDDKPLWFQLTLTKECDKYYVTGRDITPQKKAEERFLKQARLTEDLIQHLPGIFFLADKQGQIKRWNNNLEHISKRSPAEVKNETYHRFIAPNDHEKAGRAFRKVFENGSARTELNLVSKNGETIPLLMVAFRYKTDEEPYVIGIGLDITEEKRIREALKEKEQKLEEAQRIGKMGSWTWHIPTNELYWSDEVYELYGLDKETYEPSFEGFMEMLPESELKKVEQIVDRIMSGEPWEEVELLVEKPDGSMAYIYERGEVHYDDKGNPIEVSGTMQDVTARRMTEEKIKGALKEKEILLTEVHHRVKNNLAIINGLLQLEIFNTDSDQLKKTLAESQMRIHSMALIHETLYSSGSFADISFANYIRDLTDSICHTFSSNDDNIAIEYQTEDLRLNINQAVPCALLVNELVTNACKHAFPGTAGGTIVVKLSEEDGLVHLVISDDGAGLNENVNLNAPSTLGLTLVNTLVKQLDATLELDSNDRTAFTIKFEKKVTSGSSAHIFTPLEK